MFPPAPQGQPAPMPMPEGGEGEDITQLIVKAAKQLKAIADKNGIDLMAILAEDTGGMGEGGGMPPGMPPAPPMPMG